MRFLPLFALLLVSSTVPCWAAPVTYDVVVDTSSLAGTTGSLDFNFEPGPFSASSASVHINDFGSAGTPVGSAALAGDASGALPGTVTLDNGTGFNDYFQEFMFGSCLSFALQLNGPALTPPPGTLSGSSLAFSIYSDVQGTMPALTTDTLDGYAITAEINPDGTTTLHSYVNGVTPELPTGFLMAAPLLLLPLARRFRLRAT